MIINQLDLPNFAALKRPTRRILLSSLFLYDNNYNRPQHLAKSAHKSQVVITCILRVLQLIR